MAWVKFVVCLFFGYLGLHRFMDGKSKSGLLYLFTLGLFGIGWARDCIYYLLAAAESSRIPLRKDSAITKAITESDRKFPRKWLLAGLIAGVILLLLFAVSRIPH